MRLFSIIALGAVCFGASAAVPSTFEVEAPAWNSLATSTTDGGINIRKSPSAMAPRMIYDESRIEDYDVPLKYYGYWSADRPRGTRHAVTFEGPDPVLEERDGWLKIQGIGPKGDNGWVSAKFCKVKKVAPIDPRSLPENSPMVMLTDSSDPANQYGLCVYADEMNGMIDFYVGKLVNGMLVCPYTLRCDYTFGETAPTGFSASGSGLTFHCNPAQMEEYIPVPSKFSKEIIRQVLERAVPGPQFIAINNNGMIRGFGVE